MEIEDPLNPEILNVPKSKEKGKGKLDRLKESNERMRLKVVTFEKKRKWKCRTCGGSFSCSVLPEGVLVLQDLNEPREDCLLHRWLLRS